MTLIAEVKGKVYKARSKKELKKKLGSSVEIKSCTTDNSEYAIICGNTVICYAQDTEKVR